MAWLTVKYFVDGIINEGRNVDISLAQERNFLHQTFGTMGKSFDEFFEVLTMERGLQYLSMLHPRVDAARDQTFAQEIVEHFIKENFTGVFAIPKNLLYIFRLEEDNAR